MYTTSSAVGVSNSNSTEATTGQVLKVPSWEELTNNNDKLNNWKYEFLRKAYDGYTKYPSDAAIIELRGLFALVMADERMFTDLAKVNIKLGKVPEELCEYMDRVIDTQIIPKLRSLDPESTLDRHEAARTRLTLELILRGLPIEYTFNKRDTLYSVDIEWSVARKIHGGYGYGVLPEISEYHAWFSPLCWWTY